MGPGCRLAAVLAAILAACSAGPAVDVHERAAVLPSLRVHLRPEGAERRGPGANSTVADLAYGQAEYGGGAARFELASVQGLVQLGTDPARPVSARLLGGLEFLGVGLRDPAVTGGAERWSGALGPLLGLDACVRVDDAVAVYARGTAAAMLPDTASLRGEVGLACWPVAGVELLLGHRWWRVRRENFVDGLGAGNDLDLHLSGLVFGGGVVF